MWISWIPGADICSGINQFHGSYCLGQIPSILHQWVQYIVVLFFLWTTSSCVHTVGQKLFWSTTLTMSAIIWCLSIFWAAVPLMGWGVYDFEPMRTCCTLDYTRGDRCGQYTFKWVWRAAPSLKCWLNLSFCSVHNRDYMTFMLTLVLLYLMFPALTMLSCYSSINKHFKKVHHHRVNISLRTLKSYHIFLTLRTFSFEGIICGIVS